MFGLHELGGEHLIKEIGYIVYTHELGTDPQNTSSCQYPLPHIAIARLNHGYGSAGTIPVKSKYMDFSIRVGNWVRGSSGCHKWIVGNEPNLSRERPNGQVISAKDYSDCFLLCRDQILSISGHEQDEVIPAPIGPWNVETGDWLVYFNELLTLCKPNAIALHTYSRGPDPQSIFSNDGMDPPYEDRYAGFRAYRDFMYAILKDLLHVPVYITECNQNQPWADVNSGWVRNAYQEIKDWNKAGQTIYALVLYRWPKYDEYYIDGKTGVQEDFLQAQEEEVGEMRITYQTSFEEGSYNYQDDDHMTCPVGWGPGWNDAYGPRAEWDMKDANLGHPEVRTGRFAANFFHVHVKYEAWLSKTFTLPAGVRFRVSGYCYGVHDKLGGAGMIIRAGGFESDWWSTHMSEYSDRVWKKLVVEGIVPTDGILEVVLLGRTDDAISWHTHWDDIVVEVEDSTPPIPPIAGNHTLRVRADIDNVSLLDESIPLEVGVTGTTITKASSGFVANLLGALRRRT